MTVFGRMLSLGPLVGVLLLAGCGGGGGGDGQDPKFLAGAPISVAQPIAFESVERRTLSGVKQKKNVVIKDANAWATLWTEHASTQIPAQPLPAVDFSRKMLLGVFSGPSNCISMSVVRVALDNGKITAEYEERGVAPGMACAAVVSYPVHIVAVDRSEAPVEFVKVGAP